MSDMNYLDENEVSTSVGKFLTFMSDGITFGVSTEYVIEIIANYSIRPINMVPDYVKGVINLRGQVLPVVDLRLIFNKPEARLATTCIVILDINSVSIGLIVDSVLQVQEIDTKHTAKIPNDKHTELTNGMLSLEDGSVVLMLDCNAIIEHS